MTPQNYPVILGTVFLERRHPVIGQIMLIKVVNKAAFLDIELSHKGDILIAEAVPDAAYPVGSNLAEDLPSSSDLL
ncbi:MAG: hypothetical protein R2758_05985 [Bacteroidales bacterium]